jgi:hypothetical protein
MRQSIKQNAAIVYWSQMQNLRGSKIRETFVRIYTYTQVLYFREVESNFPSLICIYLIIVLGRGKKKSLRTWVLKTKGCNHRADKGHVTKQRRREHTTLRAAASILVVFLQQSAFSSNYTLCFVTTLLHCLQNILAIASSSSHSGVDSYVIIWISLDPI